jgi:proteasome lid subunit RPN8/RPN11
MKLILPQTLHDHICTHLESAFPNEGGGFLVGNLTEEARVITEIHPVQNAFDSEEQYHRFLAEDGAFQRIEDDADARGLSLLGYFHSHPDSPAIPSEFDRVHAFPFFAYLIVSIRAGHRAESLLWELKDDRSAFVAGELVIPS